VRAQAAGADAFFELFLAWVAWVLVDFCDFDAFVVDDDSVAIGLAAGADAACANAPTLTAEATMAARMVFMVFPCVGWDGAECSGRQRRPCRRG
jgi:hypothetical protein